MTPSPIGSRPQKPLARPQEDPIMISLPDLLARVEAAEGPDRELDCRIACAVDPGLKGEWQVVKPPFYDPERYFSGQPGMDWIGYDLLNNAPVYTASLDATLALVERVLPGCWYIIGKGKLKASEPLYGAQLLFGDSEVLGEGESDANLPLALLCALLKVLIAKETDMASSSPSDPLSGFQP
jgi:hypothetical protein